MQVSRKIQLAILATALSFGGVAGAHEFPARQSSDIQAYGNDPVAWSLDIVGATGRMTLTLEGETASYTIPMFAPNQYRDDLKMVYRVPNDRHVLTVFIKGQACRDTASGKAHEVTVIVSQDGKGYFGCGDVHNR